MLKRKASYPAESRENMRGGEGCVTIEKLLTPAELYEKGRMFAKITLLPGCSIGYHVHEDEMESYHILSGEAEYMEDGGGARLFAGDTTLTLSGQGHSIKNTGDSPLEIIALVLFK